MSIGTLDERGGAAGDAASLEAALRGDAIYGDGFGPDELAAWYADEKEGFADLYAVGDEAFYPYHAMNRHHGFNRLPPGRRFAHALGIGAAHGREIEPIAGRVTLFTILEPSDQFKGDAIAGTPARWVKPAPSGDMPFDDGTFDLVTCFGVLHHIPNVSHVIAEIARTMRPGGFALIREPIVSMGDWRRSRPGLTKRERGLPRKLFLESLERSGLRVRHEGLCMFRPWVVIADRLKVPVFDRDWSTKVDAALSSLMRWHTPYHATSAWDNVRPASMFVVAEKVSTAG